MSNPQTPGHWIDAAAAGELRSDDVIGVQVQGLDLALYAVEGELFATQAICTHGHARLCDGFLLGHDIECPLHQGRFDIRTGQASCEPAVDALKTYPVKLEAGRVWVRLE